MISANHPSGDVALVSLQANNDPSKVRATIRSGSDSGVISFGKAQLADSGTTKPGNAPVAANSPSGPAAISPAPEPPAPPSAGVPAEPHVRRVIQRTAALPMPTRIPQTP